jgi:hypothetical protein
MNNLYYKVAVASICTALSFTLGANKEAKAATFTLQYTTSFFVVDANNDRLGDWYYGGSAPVGGYDFGESRTLYEFDLANLSLTSTIISSAIFQVRVDTVRAFHRYFQMELWGYRGNGEIDVSDFEAGEYLGSTAQGVPNPNSNFDISFDVTRFVNQRVNNNDNFAGFSMRANDWGNATLTSGSGANLIITTADVSNPVPEPTTIFGSALALGVGGWLKRKKSSQKNKTTPQG